MCQSEGGSVSGQPGSECNHSLRWLIAMARPGAFVSRGFLPAMIARRTVAPAACARGAARGLGLGVPTAFSGQKRLLGRRQLAAVVAARKQVAIGVRRHLDRGVTEPRLHHLERQLEPAVDAPVDAPRGIEMAEACRPGYFASPCRSTTPAATCAGCKPRSTMVLRCSMPPRLFGKTSPSSLLGQARRCSRSAVTTIGGSGTVRSPASDFGRPILP